MDAVYFEGADRTGNCFILRIGRRHGRKCELWLSVNLSNIGTFIWSYWKMSSRITKSHKIWNLFQNKHCVLHNFYLFNMKPYIIYLADTNYNSRPNRHRQLYYEWLHSLAANCAPAFIMKYFFMLYTSKPMCEDAWKSCHFDTEIITHFVPNYSVRWTCHSIQLIISYQSHDWNSLS